MKLHGLGGRVFIQDAILKLQRQQLCNVCVSHCEIRGLSGHTVTVSLSICVNRISESRAVVGRGVEAREPAI